jgi:hypothetical protein
LNFDAGVEDDDLAAMMDTIEHERCSAGAKMDAKSEAVSQAAAAAISRSELGEDWTPRPGPRQAGGGGCAGAASWVPTPKAVAPDTGQSMAPVEHEVPVADENHISGYDLSTEVDFVESPFRFRPVVSAPTPSSGACLPSWSRPRRTSRGSGGSWRSGSRR